MRVAAKRFLQMSPQPTSRCLTHSCQTLNKTLSPTVTHYRCAGTKSTCQKAVITEAINTHGTLWGSVQCGSLWNNAAMLVRSQMLHAAGFLAQHNEGMSKRRHGTYTGRFSGRVSSSVDSVITSMDPMSIPSDAVSTSIDPRSTSIGLPEYPLASREKGDQLLGPCDKI